MPNSFEAFCQASTKREDANAQPKSPQAPATEAENAAAEALAALEKLLSIPESRHEEIRHENNIKIAEKIAQDLLLMDVSDDMKTSALMLCANLGGEESPLSSAFAAFISKAGVGVAFEVSRYLRGVRIPNEKVDKYLDRLVAMGKPSAAAQP